MDKLLNEKTFANRKWIAAATVAMCMLGSMGGGELQAAPVPQVVAAQKATMTISGTVKDQNGQPIIGANVMEKNTTRGIVTDLDGKFTLKVAPNATIIISYLGYGTQELKASASMDVVLEEDNAMLDELVVVGYGQQKKANLTGAVSVVDIDKTLEARPEMDFTKALQGAVPGLTILNTQGGINSQPSMKIRGVGSLSNNEVQEPFVVIDGVPSTLQDLELLNPADVASVSVMKDAASSSIYGSRAAFGVLLITTKTGAKTDKVQVSYTNNFAWSTPTILPDYADVPSQLEALVEVNKRTGTPPELFGMYMDKMLPYAQAWQEQNGGKKSGYREMRPFQNWDNVGDYYVDPQTGGVMYYADWDVRNIMYRNWTPSQTHNVNVNGTSGRTNYYLGVGYNTREGVLNFNTDKVKRYNITANITTSVTDWLQIGARINYTDRTYTEPNTRRSPYQYMWRWGSFFEPLGTIGGTDMKNTISYLKQAGEEETSTNKMRITGFMKANIVKGLTLNADYTYEVRNLFQNIPGYTVSGYNSWGGNVTDIVEFSSDTYLQQQSEKRNYWATNVYANYELGLGKHNLNIMLGGNAEGQEYRWHRTRTTGLLSESQPEFPLTSGDKTIDGRHTHEARAGYFGRINYNWNEIWLLELNGRLDGSSSFPANDRWGFFPSGSIGYRFSEESYFEGLRDIVSNGKLRGSFGEIGNDKVGENMYISTISAVANNTTYVHWLGADGTLIRMFDTPSIVSSTLTWERIQTADIGLDLGFLNNSLNFTFDWYQRKTMDMLAPSQTLPDVLGGESPMSNSGTLRTRGWELSASWNHRFGDFDVYVSGNVSDYKTVVTKWTNDAGVLSDYFSGKVYGDVYGFETDRLFQESDFNADGSYKKGVPSQTALEQGSFHYGPGDVKFKDLDGSGVIDGGSGTKDDMGDLTVIGNTEPRFQYGFRLGGAWKGIDIDMYFQGVGKWDQWTISSFVVPFSRGADGIYENQMDYWTTENTDAYWPRLYPGNEAKGTVPGLAYGTNNFYPQSKFLIDRSYLRFKNLTVGYTLPQSLTKKWYIQKLRVYFTAENLCELINNSIAPVDPEIDDSESGNQTYGVWGRIAPMMRTVSFGLQVTF